MEKLKSSFNHFRRTPAFTGFCLFFVALILNAAIQGPAKFFSPNSYKTLITTNLPFLMVVLGQAVLLLAGTMDISVGIQLAMVNVVIIMTAQEWLLPFPVACLLGILAAILISILLWVCVSIFRLPALLASFAMTYVIKGINVLIMSVPQGKVEKIYYKTYASFFSTFFPEESTIHQTAPWIPKILSYIPVALLVFLLAYLIWAYCSRTRFGTYIYAVGGDQRNAFAAGVSPRWVTFQAFVVKGIYTGIGGICLTLMTASGNPLQAEDYGLRSLSASIIGGLGFGGWGSMACGFFGGGFLVLVQNTVYYFFNLLYKLIPGFSVTTYWHNFVSDIIIFLGLLMTIVTAKGQRETLKQGIARELKQTKDLIGGEKNNAG